MNRSMFVAALVVSAFLSTAPTVGAEDMQGLAMKPATSPADKAFAASMQTMMNAMQVKPTGKPDKDFVLMMIPHHQGAIDMAKVELQYGADPELAPAGDRHRRGARQGNRGDESLAGEKRPVKPSQPLGPNLSPAMCRSRSQIIDRSLIDIPSITAPMPIARKRRPGSIRSSRRPCGARMAARGRWASADLRLDRSDMAAFASDRAISISHAAK